MTDVSADTGSGRQHQNRVAQRRARTRRRLRVVTRRVELEPELLDALETRGYLNPFDRTKAEVNAAAASRRPGPSKNWTPALSSKTAPAKGSATPAFNVLGYCHSV
jgi:hypothetical protein